MKNFKFSRLFAAMMFVACLVLTGCKPAKDPTAAKAIEGTWVSSYGEKYVITSTDYDNYYKSGDDFALYYSTNNVQIVEIDSKSGFVYGQFDDDEHKGYGAKLGQWYALYYSDLTSSSVKLYQPYKNGGKAGCDSLDEAKAEYTWENKYFAGYSECTKQ